MKTVASSFHIFLQFLRKDFYSYRYRIGSYIFNYSILYASLYAFSFGYLQPSLYFRENSTFMGTVLFIGSIFIAMLVQNYKLTINLLYDLEQDRYIDYQISLLSPRFVLIERILFAGTFSFLILAAYFPIAKLLLRDYFITTHMSWPFFLLILYLGCLLCASYNIFLSCFLKNSSSISHVWRLVNSTIFLLGGTWLPWKTINQYSQLLGSLTLLNPFLYITEGLRQAALNSPEFVSLPVCIAMLLLGIAGFTLSSFYFFKKKVDHI
jgi:ABC-2 type transport system permease protein